MIFWVCFGPVYLIFSVTPWGTPMLTVADRTLCRLIFLSAPYSTTVPNQPVLERERERHRHEQTSWKDGGRQLLKTTTWTEWDRVNRVNCTTAQERRLKYFGIVSIMYTKFIYKHVNETTHFLKWFKQSWNYWLAVFCLSMITKIIMLSVCI